MHDQDEQFGQFERDESAPVDMLAALFEARGWSFELDGDDEITAEYKGSWTSYQIRAIWRDEDNALQLLVLVLMQLLILYKVRMDVPMY